MIGSVRREIQVETDVFVAMYVGSCDCRNPLDGDSSEKRDSDGFLQRPSKSFAAAYRGS